MNKRLFLLLAIPLLLLLATTIVSAEHRVAYNLNSYPDYDHVYYKDGFHQTAIYLQDDDDRYRVRTYYSNKPYTNRYYVHSYPVYTTAYRYAPKYYSYHDTVWDYHRPYRHHYDYDDDDYDYYQIHHTTYKSRHSYDTGYTTAHRYYY